MAKIRVHELAKELNIISRELVQTLQNMGMDIKNHMSTLEESQVDWVKSRINQANAKESATEKKQESSQMQASQPQSKNSSKNIESGRDRSKNTFSKNKNEAQNQNKQQTSNKKIGGQNQSKQESVRHKHADDQSKQKPIRQRPVGDNQPSGQKPAGQHQPSQKPSGQKPVGQHQTKQKPSGQKTSYDNKKGQQNNRNNQPQRRDYSKPQKKKHKKKKVDTTPKTPDVITILDTITVRELAEKLNKGSAEIVKKLMELGTMATINQVVDFETAEIIASLYEVRVERGISEEEKILEEIVDSEESLEPRPPIVTVMGHVDHGKTSLLDRIRKADVASGEAGGITQHIGAYQVKVNENRVTFIDTPGHEAFTSMRARGANITDIVILVVAADDGVMPQTIEAINHIKAAEVPFVVAVNKIDKTEANQDKIMQQLTEYNIVPEAWGGETIFAPVSAITGEGIENLLEMLLLVAEMNEISANPDRAAEGVVIEGELDKGRGPVATVLVQKGTLKVGDSLLAGFNWCKVRAMTDDRGRRVEEALPSTPVEIMGWSDVPEAGTKVQVVDEKIAKEVTNLRLTEKKIEEQKQQSKVSLDDFFEHMKESDIKDLNLIIKGDVQGSVEALIQSLIRLSTDEVKVNVIHSGVGAIIETDVMLASASNAIIIGFNVRPDTKARKHAENEGIDIRLYRVIYEAIDDVKKAMAGLLDPEYKEKFLGRAEVRATFKVPNVGTIGGCYVIEGKIQRNSNVRVLRDGVIIYEGKLASLKRFKDDVREVAENYECGMGIKDFNDIKEGDLIEAYILEEVARNL
ncbi:Translation initiation factor 2 [Candidatus Syntrophocurvum alkaliphilum]|uniref:Translation initiation factor IF-2 n=1 Tax=Candidatus Syntrophocurvum alkaliphilum TaxID=2293317 RepID=A0A6I6D8F7_9FIRM|nr:translation initiation factor IF-2 [Candidatus Syntrophocurvum alkaliphilum]QGT99213.1 Translation initiation factor 2 [Candidatus Syntrophocurvum alkaliphilum]